MKNKKKTVLIVVVAVLVVALLAAGITLLKKDRFGYNYFQRNQTIASVGDLKVTRGEFAITFNDYCSNISTYNLYALYFGYGNYYDIDTEEGLNDLREDILQGLLEQKAYMQMAEEMGITLTEEEEAECKQDGQDAYDELYEQCIESAKNSGATTPETYATTTIGTYFSNMGLTKSSYIQRQVESSRANLLADKVYAQLKEEQSVTDEELPEIYEKYVQEYYVDGYTDGAYASYESYRQQGQVETSYLYVPENFVFVRMIVLNAADLADEFMAKIAEDPAQFEELLKSEDNLDTFIATLEEADGYGIGENDSLYDASIYEAAKEMEVGSVQMVTVETSSTDDDGNTTVTPTYYIIKRIEGEPAGIVAYEKVAEQMKDTLINYVKTNHATERLESWMENAGIYRDDATISALEPIS